jgi:hypothetical protein
MNNGTYLFEVICPSLVCPAANIRVSKETSSIKTGTSQTHSNRRREYIQRPHWRRTLLRSLLELSRFQIYNHIFINVNPPSIYANTQLIFSNVAASLGLSPKARRWLLDAYPVLDVLLQQIALIQEQNQRHLRQLRRGADRLPRTKVFSRRLMLLASRRSRRWALGRLWRLRC